MTIEFNARESLARVSEIVHANVQTAGGKRKHMAAEDQRQVVRSLGEILIRSTLTLVEMAKGAEDVSIQFYADALANTWCEMTSERCNEAVRWIENLPRKDANHIRRSLVPILAEQDPASGRLLLPANTGELSLGSERKQIAKDWLKQDATTFERLLVGDLLEYQVTRVLRIFLQLAKEPAIGPDVRAQVVRIAAQAITDHRLAEMRTGLEAIFPALGEIVRGLPSLENGAVEAYLRDRTPQVASRLGLTVTLLESTPKHTADVKEPRGTETREEAPQERVPIPPVLLEVPAAKSPDVLTESVPTCDVAALVASLETRGKEHRHTGLILAEAASQLRLTGARVEALLQDARSKEEQLRTKDAQLRNRDEAVNELKNSAGELLNRLAEAKEAGATLRASFDSQAAVNQKAMQSLVEQVSGQTEQRLKEFRDHVARQVSADLQGTPLPDSNGAEVNGKVILYRLWEIVGTLTRNSIAVSRVQRGPL